MNTQTVNVTAEHIEGGCRNNGGSCPVSIALEKATGQSWHVGRSYAERLEYGVRYPGNEEYVTSPDLREVVNKYDAAGTMSPMTLIIDHDAKTITVQS